MIGDQSVTFPPPKKKEGVPKFIMSQLENLEVLNSKHSSSLHSTQKDKQGQHFRTCSIQQDLFLRIHSLLSIFARQQVLSFSRFLCKWGKASLLKIKNSKDILPSGEFDRLILYDDIFGPLITLHKYLQGREGPFVRLRIFGHTQCNLD